MNRSNEPLATHAMTTTVPRHTMKSPQRNLVMWLLHEDHIAWPCVVRGHVAPQTDDYLVHKFTQHMGSTCVTPKSKLVEYTTSMSHLICLTDDNVREQVSSACTLANEFIRSPDGLSSQKQALIMLEQLFNASNVPKMEQQPVTLQPNSVTPPTQRSVEEKAARKLRMQERKAKRGRHRANRKERRQQERAAAAGAGPSSEEARPSQAPLIGKDGGTSQQARRRARKAAEKGREEEKKKQQDAVPAEQVEV